MRRIVLGIVAIAVNVIASCSSDPEKQSGSEPREPTTNTSSSLDSGSNVDSNVDHSTPPSTPPQQNPVPEEAGTCSPSQGVEACTACCGAKHVGGSEVYDKAFDTCVCTACATECKDSACAAVPEDPIDGDACSTCIAQASDCEVQADQACEGSPACTAFVDCLDTSRCEPEVDGGE